MTALPIVFRISWVLFIFPNIFTFASGAPSIANICLKIHTSFDCWWRRPGWRGERDCRGDVYISLTENLVSVILIRIRVQVRALAEITINLSIKCIIMIAETLSLSHINKKWISNPLYFPPKKKPNSLNRILIVVRDDWHRNVY